MAVEHITRHFHTASTRWATGGVQRVRRRIGSLVDAAVQVVSKDGLAAPTRSPLPRARGGRVHGPFPAGV